MVFRDKYWFLSNLYPNKMVIKYRGNTYTFSCLESAFQAMKCRDIESVKSFELLDGASAKRLGRSIGLREDWEEIKVDVMKRLLEIKFSSPMMKALLKSVKEDIVEDNTWNDTFWGVCNGKGSNVLGTLLMVVRDNS